MRREPGDARVMTEAEWEPQGRPREPGGARTGSRGQDLPRRDLRPPPSERRPCVSEPPGVQPLVTAAWTPTHS